MNMQANPDLAGHLATPSAFKEAMSRISYSVSVVGTESADGMCAKTINTLVPISADEPSILVSLYREGQLTARILESRKFCVSVLSEEQKLVAEAFAKSGQDVDPFDIWKWGRLETGAPFIEGAVTCFDCTLAECVGFATHVLFIGKIVAISGRDASMPLLHHRRAYRPCSTDIIG